jgi:hypothetical protein
MSQRMMDVTSPSDRVLPFTRILAVIIVPILLAAFVILFLFPQRTGELFAWPIQPTMTSFMLGGTYLGGAYFFSRVALGRRWVAVKLGLLPVSTFAGILGLATVLHWDKFTHGLFAFQLWAILYLTLPFVIPIVWLLNRGQDPGPAGDRKLANGPKWAIGLLGAVLCLAGLVLLAAPGAMIPLWPWALTPLTARVMAAMFGLSGFVGLGVAIDGRHPAASAVLEAQIISITLILIGMLLAASEIAWGAAGAWALVIGLFLEGGLALGIIVTGRQAGASASASVPPPAV